MEDAVSPEMLSTPTLFPNLITTGSISVLENSLKESEFINL